MRHLLTILISLTVISTQIFGQNVGINSTGAAPSAWAMLDVAHTTKGLLIPRVALLAINNASPIGLGMPVSTMVYNTATAGAFPNNIIPGYYYWNGTKWVAFGGQGSLNWGLLGNAGTVDGTNFIGTTDSVNFNIKVNNQKAGLIDLGLGNTFFGYRAGKSNIIGEENTAIGYKALFSNAGVIIGESTGGFYNTAVGSKALYSNTEGESNVAVGVNALTDNIDGYYNVAVGKNALRDNVNGGRNVAIGSGAISYNDSGDDNVAIGYEALRNNSTGSSNIAIGSNALVSSNTGINNIAIGAYTAIGNNGINNIAIGYNSMYFNYTGLGNVSVGYNALQGSPFGSGSYNASVGEKSLYQCLGSFNSGFGRAALYNCTSGKRNSALGDSALYTVTTGSNNIGIGFNAIVPNGTLNNQVRIGNTAITYAGIQVAWTVTSDKRWKSEIKPSNLGLDFIKELKPVYYTRNNDETKKTEYGFIAQQVDETLTKYGCTNNGIISKDDAGMLGMRYNDLISITVKAIQEQQQQIIADKEKIKALEERLQILESKLK